MALGAVGAAAMAFFVMGIHAVTNQSDDNSKPIDTGATTVGQVTASLPADQPPKLVASQMNGAASNSAPPPTVAGPINYVQVPATSGEGYFSVPAPLAREARAAAGSGKKDGDNGKTNVAFKASTLEGARAGPAIRLTYVMMPQHIPCALDTAMDSTLAGGIACHTTQDVLSPDHVLLMPAGTQVVGTYKNDIKEGQHRLFAFAGNAITKEGIPIPLNSNVADGLGRTGINGEVDNHYVERFGAALILDLADSGMQIAQTEVSKVGQTNLNLGGGGGSGLAGLADQILRKQIDIPPTIYVAPGTIVTIAVDHPISFEDAIRITAR